MNQRVGNNVRELVRKGQQGANGTLGSSVTIEARKDGVVVNRMDFPAQEPVPVFLFIQQAMGAMAYAAQQPKQRLVLGVMPRWKVWVMRKILRAL